MRCSLSGTQAPRLPKTPTSNSLSKPAAVAACSCSGGTLRGPPYPPTQPLRSVRFSGACRMRLPPLLHRRHLLLASTAAIALAACGKRQPQAQALPAEATVLALGDSLTQGVGAKANEAWPSLLAERTGWDVINAGISGDTSAQALERLPDLLQEHAPALVVVSIGGNDFLRQMSAETAQANIRRICQQAKDS